MHKTHRTCITCAILLPYGTMDVMFIKKIEYLVENVILLHKSKYRVNLGLISVNI